MFDVYVQHQFLKTPEGSPFEVPTLALAKAIEEEWERDPSPNYAQKPLTSLVATALDRVKEARESYITYVIQSIASDVILFWAPIPESLVKLQEEKWASVLEEINIILDLELKSTLTFSIDPLSFEEEEKIRVFLYQLTAFKFAGLVHLLALTSSFCLSVLVLKGRLSPQQAWDLAHLHEIDQRRLWSEDKEGLLREQNLKEELFETVRFLELVV
ncbi:MAG TPA: ATP12 family protein [Alphaproteobacteria bacterium]|nr:ATP12 family protein [Alphaproteobacteria bacterium]